MALPAGRYGVTKKQLLKIKKLPMNTIKLIEELTEKFDLLGSAAFKNSTSVVTQSSDLVESGAVKDALRDAEAIEGKNLLPLTLDSIKTLNASGWSWNGNVGSKNGVDFTISTNSNGYVTKIRANGTATGGNANLNIINNKSYGDIILNGCPSGGSDGNYYIRSSVGSDYLNDFGDGVEITGTISVAWIGIVLNKQVTNLDFYPMIRKATETDPTYEPYYVPLKDVVPNKCDNSVIGTVEDGTNPTKSYAVNEFMVRDGAFCQVTAPVTTSSTWTEGSNYTKKSIAEVLQSLMS